MQVEAMMMKLAQRSKQGVLMGISKLYRNRDMGLSPGQSYFKWCTVIYLTLFPSQLSHMQPPHLISPNTGHSSLMHEQPH